MNMDWTQKKPIPPPTGTNSDWYWYQDKDMKEPWAVEIQAGSWKLYAYDGLWWDEPIPKPAIPCPKMDKKSAKVEEKPKKVLPEMNEIAKALQSMPIDSPKNFRGSGLL